MLIHDGTRSAVREPLNRNGSSKLDSFAHDTRPQLEAAVRGVSFLNDKVVA